MNNYPFTVEKVKSLDALANLREPWNALLNRNETRAIELTYEWQLTHWKHFAESAELFVLIVKQADSLVAVAPLKLTLTGPPGIRLRRLEFIAGSESTYQDLIIERDHEQVLECLRGYLVRNRKSWDVLSLQHIPETSSTAQYLRREVELHPLSRRSTERCMYLRTDKSWEEYVGKSKRARGRIKYYLRRLEKSSKVTFSGSLDAVQLRSNLNSFFDLHCKRWNRTDTPSHFNDNRYREFYLDVGPQLFAKRQLDLFVLAIDQSPLALILVFQFATESYFMQLTAFDPDFWTYSPSLVAIELSIRQAFADGVRLFDLGHYYPYKELWADSYSSTLDMEIYAGRIAPFCAYLMKQTSYYLRTHLRQIAAVKRILGIVRRFRMSRVRSLADERHDGSREGDLHG